MHERMIDKTTQPSDADMINAAPVFNSGGKKYGWNLQHRIGGRTLCAMYPEYGSFTALVILGMSELEQVLERLDTFGPVVLPALVETSRYHDGCWMYIRVSDRLTCQQDVQDIEQLILIKRTLPRKKPLRRDMMQPTRN
jgi:Protein of unknown function (DUF3788)